jgi:hypothetical protein
MRVLTRELRSVPAAVVTALALGVALAGCSPSRAPVATPSPSAVMTSATVTPAPSASSASSVSPAPGERAYVIGVLGDFGVDGAAVRSVVAEMRRFAPRLDAVVTTGDNAYCCGRPAQVAFARSALAPLHAKVYPALGNHDEVTGGGQPLMATFGLTQRWYDVVVGPVELVFLDANRTGDARQRAFLNGVLARPRRAAFRVVVFHQPGWSCSFHPPEPGVVRDWLPRFAGKVDLVLAGHNHTYERFAGAGGVPYVTTGGGGASLYPSSLAACRGAGHVRKIRTVHHALRITATSSRLTVEAYGTDGMAFDRFTVAAAPSR